MCPTLKKERKEGSEWKEGEAQRKGANGEKQRGKAMREGKEERKEGTTTHKHTCMYPIHGREEGREEGKKEARK